MNPTQADEAKALEIARAVIAGFSGYSGDTEKGAALILTAINDATADLRTQLADAQKQIYDLVQNAQRLVVWYETQPDGPLPNGMTNGMFLNLREAIQATRQPTQDKGDE